MISDTNEIDVDKLIEKSKPVFRYLIRAGIQKEDAEDIIQNTLIKAMTSMNTINEDKISSWMVKVARNNFYCLYRQQKKYIKIPLDSVFMELQSNIVEDNLQNILRGMIEIQTNEVLNSLSNKNDIQLLILKYYNGLSYKEISMLLNLDENTIKVYLYRARNRFKKKWIDLGYELNPLIY